MTTISQPNIPITEKMRDAINRFASTRAEKFVKVIDESYPHQSFYAGKEGDGEIGIELISNYKPGGVNYRWLLNAKEGSVRQICFTTPRTVSTPSETHMERVPEACPSEANGLVKNIDKTTLAIIIGALYGRQELGEKIKLSPEDEAAMQQLKTAF